jgi:hypothetical protein
VSECACVREKKKQREIGRDSESIVSDNQKGVDSKHVTMRMWIRKMGPENEREKRREGEGGILDWNHWLQEQTSLAPLRRVTGEIATYALSEHGHHPF